MTVVCKQTKGRIREEKKRRVRISQIKNVEIFREKNLLRKYWVTGIEGSLCAQ